MPKENRKRGRREEQKKRKRDGDDGEHSSKRAKQDAIESIEVGEASQHDAAVDGTRPEQMTFYGMLDEEEQEYFKRADEMLELNQFDDADARKLFLESVYKEADGKELKIANSQSCSRLLERLIQLSTPEQLKNLFQKFSGQYAHPTLNPSDVH
jgi:nucleolar protein 9